MTDRLALSELVVHAGRTPLVHGVSLTIDAGELVALVGASGSGKTLTARSLAGLVRARPGVTAGELTLTVDGRTHTPYRQCLGKGERALHRAFADIRGGIVGYLPQDTVGSLDPLWSVGRHLRAALQRADRPLDPTPWLSRAGFPDPERIAHLFPHELSGGMSQRVAIAILLARGGRFLVADEPTTGLDPTVQQGVLDELRRLVVEERLGVLLITHDLRIVPRVADRVLVMDGGHVVERLTPAALQEGALRSAPGRALVEATRRVASGGLG